MSGLRVVVGRTPWRSASPSAPAWRWSFLRHISWLSGSHEGGQGATVSGYDRASHMRWFGRVHCDCRDCGGCHRSPQNAREGHEGVPILRGEDQGRGNRVSVLRARSGSGGPRRRFRALGLPVAGLRGRRSAWGKCTPPVRQIELCGARRGLVSVAMMTGRAVNLRCLGEDVMRDFEAGAISCRR